MCPPRVLHGICGAFVALLLTAHPGRAQVSARGDLSVRGRYVWHGLSRAAGLVMQPSLGVGMRTGRWTLDVGVVRHYELDHIAPGELSQVGEGDASVGEDDFWARTAIDLTDIGLAAGVVRYVFRGSSSSGGMGSDRNTTELYGALSLTDVYLNPTLEAWVDVDRVRGVFLQGSIRTPLLGYPFQPFVFVYLDAEAGLNVGQGPNPSRPTEQANFAGRGVTHAGFGATVELHNTHWPGVGLWSVSAGARSQINFDEATRFNGLGRQGDFFVWLWTGATVVLGGDARRVR